MKKKLSLYACLCILLLSVLCMFTSCSEQPTEDKAMDIQSINITLSIDYPKKSTRSDINEVPFRLEEDTTVLQLIELYGNVNNLPILVDTTHSTLEAINGVQSGIFWKDGQWKFTVNGKYATKSESEKLVEDGDFVKFIYVRD